MLLSRVADNLYWGARYLERAEGTARIVRSYTELLVDLPTSVGSTWEPLLAIAGAPPGTANGEIEVVRFLVADQQNPGSIASSISHARENLRTTREVLPTDAWQTVNDLSLYMGANAAGGVERRSRARVLGRVIADCQRMDGVLSTVMTRDAAHELWRLGQSIERADMTTRVVGVRAAALLAEAPFGDVTTGLHDDVQWMGLLRSVSALQMYQRATRGPVEGARAVRFLLFDPGFPRSVTSCVERARIALERLPKADATLPAITRLTRLLERLPTRADDGQALDSAMDDVQAALAELNDAVRATFVRVND